MLSEKFRETRAFTSLLVSTLKPEDYVIQVAEYMSPPRWHLGHTTWFFEQALNQCFKSYEFYDRDYNFFFNSYYERFGKRLDRPLRGTRSRPTVEETMTYRNKIDGRVLEVLSDSKCPQEFRKLVALGLEHEKQHQELLVWDIKLLLKDVFEPPFRPNKAEINFQNQCVDGFAEFDETITQVGSSGSEFSWDNERPRHRVLIPAYKLGLGLVTQGEYLQFMEAGGYEDPRWWLSDGWKTVQDEGWTSPLYWEKQSEVWHVRSLNGFHRVEDVWQVPVTHLSYYEASAYSKWRGARLPTEFEWENAAVSVERCSDENFVESGNWEALPCYRPSSSAFAHMHGNVWEWTSSDYAPYPGFKTDFDEYNDKWFVNQRVVRGGSYATPRDHYRPTYRNFFYPKDRWVGLGFRLASS